MLQLLTNFEGHPSCGAGHSAPSKRENLTMTAPSQVIQSEKSCDEGGAGTARPRNSQSDSPPAGRAVPIPGASDLPLEYEEPLEPVQFDFGLKRRGFVQLLG